MTDIEKALNAVPISDALTAIEAWLYDLTGECPRGTDLAYEAIETIRAELAEQDRAEAGQYYNDIARVYRSMAMGSLA